MKPIKLGLQAPNIFSIRFCPLPPAPPLPPLAASLCSHFVRKSRLFRSPSRVILVSNCGSPRSKLSNVGILLIPYLIASGPSVGLSSCTSAKLTPPWASPTPDSTSSVRMGRTALQEAHQVVLQNVISGRRDDVESRTRLSNSSSCRTLRSGRHLPFQEMVLSIFVLRIEDPISCRPGASDAV